MDQLPRKMMKNAIPPKAGSPKRSNARARRSCPFPGSPGCGQIAGTPSSGAARTPMPRRTVRKDQEELDAGVHDGSSVPTEPGQRNALAVLLTEHRVPDLPVDAQCRVVPEERPPEGLS